MGGKAKRMFISQYQFPLVCGDKDIHEIFHSQRISGFANVCKRYNFEEAAAESFFRKNLPSTIIKFLSDLFSTTRNGMKDKEWSGYQVFADAKEDGHTEWTFQLFLKHPDSKTELYDELPELGKGTII